MKTRTATAAIPRRVPAEHAPLSFAQQRLWFSYQLAPERPLYNISVALRLQGRLDCVALEKSLAAIVARHESLRTRYVCVGDEPFQVIDGSPAVRLAVVDLKAVSEDQRDAEIERLLREEASRPFNLSRDLMLRAVLARFGAADQILYLTLHHIAADGWSLGVLFNELGELYKAYVDGRPPALLELPIQYADFAIWQRERMQRDVLHRELAYWKRQLAGAPDFLELPADRPRPAVQSFRGRWQWTTFPKPLCDAAKAFSQREGVTLFMMLLATFQTLLHRYTGKADILVGSPIAGRTRIETERLIGFFINTLVLRGNFSGHPTGRELLRRVREMTLDAYAHQDLPFEKLVDQLRPERSSSHSPLIQVLFLMQNAPAWPLSLPGLTVTPIPVTKVDNGTAKLDLTLQTEDSEEGLRVGLEYNSDLFEEATMARLLGHFQTLLEGIVAKPNERVSELPLLTTVERKQLLVDWNNTRRDFSQDKTIPELFKEQAATRPDAVAATFEERHLTYRELDRRADQFAAFLQKQGPVFENACRPAGHSEGGRGVCAVGPGLPRRTPGARAVRRRGQSNCHRNGTVENGRRCASGANQSRRMPNHLYRRLAQKRAGSRGRRFGRGCRSSGESRLRYLHFGLNRKAQGRADRASVGGQLSGIRCARAGNRFR